MKKVFFATAFFFLIFDSFGQSESQKYYKEFYESITNKDTTTALLYLDSLIQNGNNTDAILMKGSLENRQGRYQSAVITFTQALNLRPGLIDGYVRRGVSYLNLGKYDSAINDFNTAIGKYPWQDSVAYQFRAFCHLNLMNYEKSIVDCDSALRYNPSSVEVLRYKSGALLGMGKPQEALKQVNAALALDAYHKEALKLKCSILIVLQKNEEALSFARKYISKYKDDSAINFLLGNIYVQLKQPSKALEYLNKVSYPENETWEFFATRGTAYFFLVDNQAAIADLKKTMAIKPDYAEIYVLLADCYIELGETRIACEYLHKAWAMGISEAERAIRESCNN